MSTIYTKFAEDLSNAKEKYLNDENAGSYVIFLLNPRKEDNEERFKDVTCITAVLHEGVLKQVDLKTAHKILGVSTYGYEHESTNLGVST
jgi:hypothetical protein